MLDCERTGDPAMLERVVVTDLHSGPDAAYQQLLVLLHQGWCDVHKGKPAIG